MRKPTIAAINGMAFGGGLELAMMCDILMCSENAKMGLPEIKLGVMPGAGGTVRITQAVGKSKAMQMVLTGEPLNAQDALKWGLVSQVHSKEKLVEEAFVLANKIAAFSQVSAASAKRAIKSSLESGETVAIDHERSLFIGLMNTHDKKEGVSSFLAKKKPQFKDM